MPIGFCSNDAQTALYDLVVAVTTRGLFLGKVGLVLDIDKLLADAAVPWLVSSTTSKGRRLVGNVLCKGVHEVFGVAALEQLVERPIDRIP